jgi:RNA polymerase subunit RPABC4/transcription elongation factor Spt4
MEKTCANCGNKSNEDTTFCTKCGTPYPAPEELKKAREENLAKRQQAEKLATASAPMKKCPHCQKEIDIRATKCPYCQSNLKSSAGKIILFIILGLIVLFIVWSIASSGQTEQQATQQANLQSCLSQADSAYTSAFQKECITEGGVNNSGPGCKVYTNQATLLDGRHQDAIDNCYHTYPQQ